MQIKRAPSLIFPCNSDSIGMWQAAAQIRQQEMSTRRAETIDQFIGQQINKNSDE